MELELALIKEEPCRACGGYTKTYIRCNSKKDEYFKQVDTCSCGKSTFCEGPLEEISKEEAHKTLKEVRDALQSRLHMVKWMLNEK